ncbi:Aste57867_1486 [Aphanomyces stellatus]|uniref:Aste57867_1486 protein n=1 Tax=Aphanomyces stellatus TaxID=120398 RepID=A0A485K7Y6_9STRA|nr:hypothetical protein As57867_001485 [Aphanomyces stellatus]VFT78702.1 Aste57867_1486 [Aphanomyces stellatus]
MTTLPIIFDERLPKRGGRWTPEEDALARRIAKDLNAGLVLDIASTDAKTVRQYLARVLHCDPMRVSKKFPKKGQDPFFRVLSNEKYVKNEDALARLSKVTRFSRQKKLEALVANFVASLSTSESLDVSSLFESPLLPLQPPNCCQASLDSDPDSGHAIEDEVILASRDPCIFLGSKPIVSISTVDVNAFCLGDVEQVKFLSEIASDTFWCINPTSCDVITL